MAEPAEPTAAENEKPRSVVGIVIRVALVGLVIYLLWGNFRAIDWGNVVDAIAGLSTADWIRLILMTAAYFVAESLIRERHSRDWGSVAAFRHF